jgi:hypothetical protein
MAADLRPMDRLNNAPIVVDLGRQKSKRVKALKRGEGPLMEKVDAALLQAKSTSGGREVIPVVFVFERKSRRKRGISFAAPY